MRLVNVTGSSLCLEEFGDSNAPEYAILSHTWGNEEVLFEHMPIERDGTAQTSGLTKVRSFCSHVRSRGLRYAWIDTCCINKISTTELSEAINSMYRWYKQAAVCVAFLADHDVQTDEFKNSRWFTRGWTLQELIAPKEVEFYDKHWLFMGNRSQLKTRISVCTGIDERVLDGADPTTYSIAQRMSWAAGRQTTRIEDRAYSLLGLFDVTIPLIYGVSNSRNAFIVLQEEIIKHSDDQTIFAWSHGFSEQGRGHCGLLAESPDAFAGSEMIVPSSSSGLNASGYGITNVGLILTVKARPYAMRTYVAILDCTSIFKPHMRYGIFVEKLEEVNQYARVQMPAITIIETTSKNVCTSRKICVRQKPGRALNQRYGVWVRFTNYSKYYAAAGDDDEEGEEAWPRIASTHVNQRRHPSRCFIERPLGFGDFKDRIVLPPRPRQLHRDNETNPFQLDSMTVSFDKEFLPTCRFTARSTQLSESTHCNTTNLFHRIALFHDSNKNKKLDLRRKLESSTTKLENELSVKRDQRPDPAGSFLDLEGRVSVRVRMQIVPCDPPPHMSSGDSDWRIWQIDVSEYETYFPVTHDEAVHFGLRRPCAGTVSSLVDLAVYGCSRVVGFGRRHGDLLLRVVVVLVPVGLWVVVNQILRVDWWIRFQVGA